MRVELKRLQTELKQTIIYTTHDQIEAMSMADRILLLRKGKTQQCDVPEVVYSRPSNKFVANFIASPNMNFIDCTLISKDDKAFLDAAAFTVDVTSLKDAIEEQSWGPEFTLGVRPEHIYVGDEQVSEESFQATIDLMEPLGNLTIIYFKADGVTIKAVAPADYVPKVGERKWISFDKDKIYVFDRRTEKAII